MVTRQTTVTNRSGLHARPASDFILEAKKYESKVTIKKAGAGSAAVNAKSIARLLGEGIVQGDCIEISAEGVDAEQAVASLVSLVESGFGE